MTRRNGRDRVGVWIAGLATAIGLWMGLTAPSISPVTPAPPGTGTGATSGQLP